MKRICILSAAAAIILLAQCSPKTPVTKTEVPPVNQPATASAEDVAHGQVLFQANCGKCHKLYMPEEFSVRRWNRILPEMYQKSKFDATKAALVDAYVLSNAKKG